MITPDQLDETLKSMLQKNITVNINSKAIREGVLILYNVKDYYITLNIRTKKDQLKTYEIPVPFNIDANEERVIFDYHIEDVIQHDPRRRYLINSLYSNINKKSKLFDNILTIKFSE